MSEDKDAPVVEDAEVAAEVENQATGDEAQAQETQPEAPSDSSTEKKEPKGVQKRIDELTRNWRDTERDRDYWRELAVRANQQPQQTPQEPQKPGRTLEDFEYDEGKYQAYLIEQAREEARRIVQDEYKRESQGRKQSSFKSKEAEFAKTAEDYHSVTRNPSLTLTQEMVDVVADAEKGPEVLYYLGKNPDIADRLSSMSPLNMAMEIGRIEAKLASTPKGSSVSKAPPPTPKIEAVSPALDVKASDPESDSLSTKEWVAKRNKELANRS